MKDALDNRITAIHISRNEVKIDAFDVEAAVLYTTQFIHDVARQWQDRRDANQKQRLQRLVLKEGIVYDRTSQSFGTAILSPIFKLNEEFSGDESKLVAAVLQNWHQILLDIQEIAAFAKERRALIRSPAALMNQQS